MKPERSHLFLHRPPWWPENEPWPPVKGRMRRNPFFRRLGCAFAVFNIFGLLIFIIVIIWLAGLPGKLSLPSSTLTWVLPAGMVLLLLFGVVIIFGILSLRRVFNPLDDLLEAAGKIAQGNYAIHLLERGLPEIRSLTRAFNNMAARLNLADKKRRHLLADVTHELRSPLTVLQGNLEGMLDGIYPTTEANLRSLLEETKILSRLIDDLRILALAENGALVLKLEPTDVLMLVRDTVSSFQKQADALGVKLLIVPDGIETGSIPQEALILELDPGRFRQVLSNLLSNALRYCPSAGEIRVHCALVARNFVLEISDEGPGIAPEDLPYIFDRYYKSADSNGMGLGLSIVKHLVTAHHGTIEALSAPGQGSTIRITLPI